jgi:hypothetical protein
VWLFDARWVGEAIMIVEKTNERWCEAEINRIAGEIALMSTATDGAKAQSYFERALTVARAQQAKSPGSCALLPALRGFGAIRASRSRLAVWRVFRPVRRS